MEWVVIAGCAQKVLDGANIVRRRCFTMPSGARMTSDLPTVGKSRLSLTAGRCSMKAIVNERCRFSR
jgi:hypothetical protein